jgi:hypothetical protein
MQIVERVLVHLTPGLGAVGPLAQHGHERSRLGHRGAVPDVREAARRRHARIPAAFGMAE